MKKSFIILLIFTALHAQPLQEMRAVWVTNVASTVLFNDANIAEGMRFLAAKGFNVVFPVVWNKGLTLYPSTVMTTLFNKPIDPAMAGRDPLKKIIFEAHRHGMEVIPWFEFGFSSSYSQNGGHLIAQYPQWAAKNNAGQLVVKNGFDWMAGTNPEVQNFMLSLITEVIDNYDVDGVQGDDRLPAMPIEGGYDDTTKAIYKRENGGANPPSNHYDLNWKKWRANKLTNFLKRMRDSVKVRGNQLILSVAPSPYSFGYDEYLQDSKTWVDSGIVDNFIPQLYRYDVASYQSLLNTAAGYVPANRKNIFFAGILAKKDTSFILSSAMAHAMINSNRAKGVQGESFFFYEAFPQNNGRLADSLRAGAYRQDALPPFRNGKIWRPKATIINEDDSISVVKQGAWQRVPIQGNDPFSYYTNSPNPASLEYFANTGYGAWFDVYAYGVAYFSFTQNARFTLYSGSDSSVVIVNQQNTKNNGWIYLGTVYLSPGSKRFLKIDNGLVEPGKYLYADAALFMINRKRSPDVVITGIGSQHETVLPPAGFSLSQNYPNPFNPITMIQYQVPDGQDGAELNATSPSHPSPYKGEGNARSQSGLRVRLIVYDILGRKVATLVDEEKAAGTYTVPFNASSLPSGTYFYELRTDTYREAKKMLLLK